MFLMFFISNFTLHIPVALYVELNEVKIFLKDSKTAMKCLYNGLKYKINETISKNINHFSNINILVSKNAEIKIIDFGMSEEINNNLNLKAGGIHIFVPPERYIYMEVNQSLEKSKIFLLIYTR